MSQTIAPEITESQLSVPFVRHRRRSPRPEGLRIDPVLQTTVGSLIDKAATKLQGVHTLAAMPQWYINFNLEDLLKYGRTTTGASLQDVALRMSPGQDAWLRGKVSKIATTVYVPENPAQVIFTVTFASGTMDYDTPTGKSTCDIAGLRFGIAVDLGKAQVAVKDYAELPDDVRQRIGALKPGAFTVEQLFMNLQAADAAHYDPAATFFPPAMPTAAVDQFPTYMTQYLGDVANAGGQVLGYAVEVPNANDPIATFPPTGLKLVTNQYQAGPDRDPEIDTVNYLMMTGGKAFPAELKPWWGNFVVPSDGKDDTWYGTIAMAKELFIDKFLLRRLYPLLCGYWMLENVSGTLDIKYVPSVSTFYPTTLGGTFSTVPFHSRSHRTNTWSNDDVDYTFSWDVNLNLVPGTNTVVITRVVNFDIDYTHWYGIDGHALTSKFRVWYNVPLTVTITFLGVIDGKLQVKVATSTRGPAPNTVYGDPYGWDIVKTEGSYSIWLDVVNTLNQVINNAVSAAMPAALASGVEAAITDNLNLTPFVFPGGNQLNMINPVFNDEGDLLLGLSYKS
jgi:hypothetical protein